MPIQRIDTDSTHGWQARVGPHRGKLTRFFADAKYGGSDGAYSEAELAERALAAQVEEQPRKVPSNNRSGAKGIHPLLTRAAIPEDPPLLYIQAPWCRNGRAGSTKFSTRVHGLLGAVELARKKREAKQDEPVPYTARQLWNLMRPLVGGHEA